MALKPDRHEVVTDISFFMNETAERGIIVTHSTAGSGAAMDDSNALVAIPTTASGTTPAGLLLNDVVNLDLTRQHLNQHQDEVQKGGKVTLLKQGYVVTNKLEVNSKPTVGATAYYASSGLLSTTNPDANPERGTDVEQFNTKVGRFLSTEDADGYAKVYIDIA
jgi:hypothetical protein|tara:strand:- start:108 stop:599 length:492 start_codon:yes stop_codon:yes gene_type:complete